MDNSTYGYGHTKESAQLVREALNKHLKADKSWYRLKISVRKADSGYGGPRVEIITPYIRFDKQYQYIIDDNGEPADSGTLVTRPVGEFVNGRPHPSAKLVTPEITQQLNDKISKILSQFGKDEDDAMTDYFNNTTPLFYGVRYEA